MGFTIVALVIGLLLGLVTGGRPANVNRRPLRAVGALAAAVLVQAVPEVIDLSDDVGVALVLTSYALLVVFALVNLRLVGMPVVLVGLALNVIVIAVNGGMPVRAEAILALDDMTAAELAEIDFGSKRHLEDDADRITVLGDIVPVPLLEEVLSFGDLVLAAGVANVVFRLLRPYGPSRTSHTNAPELAVLAHSAPSWHGGLPRSA